MDGTFSVTPPQFSQLYRVHGLRNEHHVIGCYALLPNKQEVTYIEFLEQVQRLTGAVTPATIMIDFERACINAVQQVYPQSSLVGCLFHLCQSVYRRVQAEGLQEQYMEDEEFRENIRMIPAIAFVPIGDIVTAFEELSQHCAGHEEVILDYFEENYIGAQRRGRRRNPLFSHELWNVNRRVEANLPRTNNMLEGWHRHFNRCFPAAHPTIWKFINVLKNDASVQQINAANYAAGGPPPKRRRIYQAINDRLRRLHADYGNRDTLEFLRGVSYNLSR